MSGVDVYWFELSFQDIYFHYSLAVIALTLVLPGVVTTLSEVVPVAPKPTRKWPKPFR